MAKNNFMDKKSLISGGVLVALVFSVFALFNNTGANMNLDGSNLKGALDPYSAYNDGVCPEPEPGYTLSHREDPYQQGFTCYYSSASGQSYTRQPLNSPTYKPTLDFGNGDFDGSSAKERQPLEDRTVKYEELNFGNGDFDGSSAKERKPLEDRTVKYEELNFGNGDFDGSSTELSSGDGIVDDLINLMDKILGNGGDK